VLKPPDGALGRPRRRRHAGALPPHDGIDDNSHFILWASGVTEPVTVDGFTIRGGVGGSAAAASSSTAAGDLRARLAAERPPVQLRVELGHDFGGAGMLLIHSAATIENCRFEMNTIVYGENGSGVAACDSDVKIVDCRFEKNPKNAVILRSGSTGTIEDCRFVDNIGWGGDVEIADSPSVHSGDALSSPARRGALVQRVPRHGRGLPLRRAT
jgi:hypothetical protein